MQILDYSYNYGTTIVDEKYIAISYLDRDKPATPQFIKYEQFNKTLTKPTALIFIDGFSTAQSETGIAKSPSTRYIPIIKTGSAYAMHEWISQFDKPELIVYADIVSSTCAAGIQAIKNAKSILNQKIAEEVIIIGQERTTEPTLQLFRELGIPVVCGDGFVYMRLGKANKCLPYITEVQWKYAYHRNPFHFEQKDLNSLIPPYPVDFVKLHGTDTESNTKAESHIATIAKPIIYKDFIGHTQGVSALLETCMLLADKTIHGRGLVTANGFGGFYGGFILWKL